VRKIFFSVLTLMLLITIISTIHAQTPQELLNQYVADLRKNPNDFSLREKIIRHVQTMKPAPAMPGEAERFEGRAEYAIKNANSSADFIEAAKEYEKALLIAPWVSNFYFNQGIALEKAGKHKEAKHSFEFYLLAAPDAQDRREVRKRIAGLEYAIEKTARESSPEAIAEKKQKSYEVWLSGIDGRRYVSSGFRGGLGVIDVRGNVMIVGDIGPRSHGPNRYAEHVRLTIIGREALIRNPNADGTIPFETIFKINEAGDRVTETRRFRDGDVREFIYNWQR